MNPINQKEIDDKMRALDGTDNKGKLGANAILAVSMAVCKVRCAQACRVSHGFLGLYKESVCSARAAVVLTGSHLWVLCLCMQAGAAEKGVPLYKHISELAGNPKLVLPVPAFNIINGGRWVLRQRNLIFGTNRPTHQANNTNTHPGPTSCCTLRAQPRR